MKRGREKERLLNPFSKVIISLSQIIAARASNIQSGWKSAFNVFSSAAVIEGNNTSIFFSYLTVFAYVGHIMCIAFELLEEIVKEHFPCIAEVFFVDCVNSLNAFANNKSNKGILTV